MISVTLLKPSNGSPSHSEQNPYLGPESLSGLVPPHLSDFIPSHPFFCLLCSTCTGSLSVLLGTMNLAQKSNSFLPQGFGTCLSLPGHASFRYCVLAPLHHLCLCANVTFTRRLSLITQLKTEPHIPGAFSIHVLTLLLCVHSTRYCLTYFSPFWYTYLSNTTLLYKIDIFYWLIFTADYLYLNISYKRSITERKEIKMMIS